MFEAALADEDGGEQRAGSSRLGLSAPIDPATGQERSSDKSDLLM